MYFHVTEGLVPDVMHDVLEGCLPYETKELLRHLFQSGVLTLGNLNEIINHFVGGGMRSETEKMTDKRKKEKEMKTERR